MFGTIEIFDLSQNGGLVYSSGHAARYSLTGTDRVKDYLIVRRYGPHHVPRAQICSLILDEFFLWHLDGVSLSEAFSELTVKERLFLTGQDTMN